MTEHAVQIRPPFGFAFRHSPATGQNTPNHPQRTPVRTPEFNAWFGDSKVVDVAGEPMVVFHGTTRTFSTFAAGRGNGCYFTDDRQAASAYAEHAEADEDAEEAGPNIMPVYLSLQNPLILDAKWQADNMGADGDRDWEVLDHALYKAEELGHDGAILRDFMDFYGLINGKRIERKYDQYIVFTPEQIKSAIGNNGGFDPNSPDIRL